MSMIHDNPGDYTITIEQLRQTAFEGWTVYAYINGELYNIDFGGDDNAFNNAAITTD